MGKSSTNCLPNIYHGCVVQIMINKSTQWQGLDPVKSSILVNIIEIVWCIVLITFYVFRIETKMVYI